MLQKPKSKRGYPQEFRDKAVKLVTDCGYTIEQVAEKLGCSKEAVRRWKNVGQKKLDPETALRMELEEKEIKRLRKENLRLQMENDILKKCGGAYFSNTVHGKRCDREVRLDRRASKSLACYDHVWRLESLLKRLLRLASSQRFSDDTKAKKTQRTPGHHQGDF
jgi:transposase